MLALKPNSVRFRIEVSVASKARVRGPIGGFGPVFGKASDVSETLLEAAPWIDRESEPRAVDFFDVKADLENLAAPLVARFEPAPHPALHPGRSARVIVDGSVSGLHRSPFHGYSAEFSQYRHYRPGDDLKFIDWKLYARTDRVYTKQYRETTNMVAQIALDASASMAYRGRDGLSKFDYGRLLAAALVHLIARQGDAPGLVVYDATIRVPMLRRLPEGRGAGLSPPVGC